MQKLIINKALGNSIAEPVNGIELKRGDSIIVSGLTAAEVVSLYVKVGDSFVAAPDSTGSATEITATVNALTVNAAGTYQVQAGATTAALVISFNTP
jgi:hypothetical protein